MWGCRCGRLCEAGDRFCSACGAPRTSGTEVRSPAERKAFLAKAEQDDAQALRGVRRIFRTAEKAFQEAEALDEKHATADYAKFDGWFGEWLRGPSTRVDPFGFPLEDDYDDYDDFD